MTKETKELFMDQLMDMRHLLYADAYALITINGGNWLDTVNGVSGRIKKLRELPYLVSEDAVAGQPGVFRELNNAVQDIEQLAYEMSHYFQPQDKINAVYHFVRLVDHLPELMDWLLTVEEETSDPQKEETENAQ